MIKSVNLYIKKDVINRLKRIKFLELSCSRGIYSFGTLSFPWMKGLKSNFTMITFIRDKNLLHKH